MEHHHRSAPRDINTKIYIKYNLRLLPTAEVTLPFGRRVEDVRCNTRSSAEVCSVCSGTLNIICGFADDVGVVITFNHSDEAEIYASKTIWMIKSRFEDFDPKLAEQKRESVLFTKQQKQKTIQCCISAHIFRSQPSLKYLIVIFDSKLRFN